MAENFDQQQVDNQNQQDIDTNDTQQDTQDTQDTQDWKQGLSDDFKNDPALEKFKDINGLAKSYKELEKLVGREKLPIPPENASKEDWDLVYSRLGRPSSPNDYKLSDETINKLPSELRNEEELKEFNKIAHESGFTAQQYQKLMDWYYDQIGQKLTQQKQQIDQSKQKGETALRKEWGKAFDSKLQLGERVLAEFGTDDLRTKIKKTGLNNDPEFIKFLSKAGEGLSEDTISGKSKSTLMTPEQAEREKAKIMGDQNHPYWKKDHPEHKFAVERVTALNEMANPE